LPRAVDSLITTAAMMRLPKRCGDARTREVA